MIKKKLEKIMEEINELHPELPATVEKEPKIIRINLKNSDIIQNQAEEVKETIVEQQTPKNQAEFETAKKEAIKKGHTTTLGTDKTKNYTGPKLDDEQKAIHGSFLKFAMSLKDKNKGGK